MRTLRVPLFICSIVMVASGSAQAQEVMKPGLWETNIIKMTVDGKDMLAQMNAAQEKMREMFAKMPPEQRKRMETMLSGTGAGLGAGAASQRVCISPAMAAQNSGSVSAPPRAECGKPKINRAGSRTHFELVCKPANGGELVSKGETLVAGNQMSTKMEGVHTKPDGTRSVSITETQMKFVGTNCGDVKPADQLLSDLQSQSKATTGAVPAKK